MTNPPETIGRGFERREFEARLARAQAAMSDDELDALVVTTAPNVRYFTGFNTQFWESPTRPWFVVVPREGEPVAVIPEIGAPGMAGTWVEDIRTWPAPRPDDDGISLLRAALTALPRRFGRVGWEMGRESVVRMPLSDFDGLRAQMGNLAFADGSPTLWSLRRVKSPGEIARVRALAADLGPSDGVLIYPEGTRFTPQRRAAVLEKLRRPGREELLARAESLANVLPPRTGGTLALLDERPDVDVVVCMHVGFDGTMRLTDLVSGALVGTTVRVRFDRISADTIPRDEEGRTRWLFDLWSGVDRWVGEQEREIQESAA